MNMSKVTDAATPWYLDRSRAIRSYAKYTARCSRAVARWGWRGAHTDELPAHLLAKSS